MFLACASLCGAIDQGVWIEPIMTMATVMAVAQMSCVSNELACRRSSLKQIHA